MDEIYADPAKPASFSGINSMHRVLKGRVKRSLIQKYLQTKDSYTLHRPVRKRFVKNRVIVGKLNQLFQADLVDMQSLSRYNDGYKYILTCIDVLSKYSFVKVLKNKKAQSVLSAFQSIFSERIPNSLQTDSGKEFTNHLIQSYLKDMHVNFYTTNNNTKASVVERFNRTLKTKMWKYFTEKNTYRYIDVIDKLVLSYNHTWHRSIQMEPASVTKENENEVWNTLYKNLSPPTAKPKFNIGDTVRISRDKLIFEKGYEKNWTIEIFTISAIVKRNPIVYRIRDLAGNEISGTFYHHELQKVTDSGYYPVEKVLKSRMKNGVKELFVKFQGYPNEFNMWVRDYKTI